MKKRIIAMLLVLVMIFALVACGADAGNVDNPSDTGTAQPGDTGAAQPGTDAGSENDKDGNGRYDLVKFAIAADPGDMLPWNEMQNYKKVIFTGLYDTLYDFIDGEYVPSAATGMPEIVDDIYYDIEIYNNIMDWEGNNLTAEDVVFCFNQYVESGFANKFTYFAGIEAIDTYKVRIIMTQKITDVNPLDKILCNVNLYTKAAWDTHEFATDPVGTGPYKLVSYTPGSKVVCEARDDYWQTDESKITSMRKRNVDTIEYIVVAEAAQNVIALNNGEIDFSLNVPAENLSDFEDNADYDVSLFKTRDCYFLSTNMSGKSVCDDVNLRLAIYYAIDNVAMANALSGFTYTTAYGSSVAADYIGAWDSQETYFNTYDLNLAKQYLDKSDYDGEELVLMAANNEAAKTIAQTVQVFLKAIGITVKLDIVENAVSAANVENDEAWDLYLQQCGGNFIVNAYNRVLNRNEHGGRCIGFINDDKLQELFEAANTADTWNDETIDAVFQYVVENAYTYVMVNTAYDIIQTKNCTMRYDWDMFVLPNACEYDLG